MKLLFDENLSPRLVELLGDIYPESQHVHSAGLGSSDDSAVWEYAKRHDFAIVSKDSDFVERSVLDAQSPKIIWIQMGNCSTDQVEAVLRSERDAVRAFLDQHGEICLLLGRR